MIRKSLGSAGERVVDARSVDIQAVRALMSMVNARSASDPKAVASEARYELDFAPMLADAREITVLVHGYNVSVEGAKADLPQLMKRLYWAGRPVLMSQSVLGPAGPRRAHTVGFAWLGNRSVFGITGVPYLADDEFSALETGVPMSLYVVREKLAISDRTFSVLAHSLGNMAVNSAIGLAPPQTFRNYVMYDAAVPIEAFSRVSFNGLAAVQTLHPHAAALGFQMTSDGTGSGGKSWRMTVATLYATTRRSLRASWTSGRRGWQC